jgi:signal transduction histidine kinase
VPPELPELADQIREAADALGAAVRELQEVSRGIHPAILSKGGLGPAIKTLARRTAMPVELDFSTDGRWPERVEVAVYYVISEALTNAAKHADASLVQVSLQAENGALVAAINDDGVGGADPEQGSGLVGLRDRVESIGGTLQIDSREGRGTLLTARIPI